MTDIFDNTFAISDHVSSTAVGDETVMLNLADGTYYGLDAVGTWIWDQLSAGVGPRRILSDMSSHYSIPLERAETDLREFLVELLDCGLLVARAS